MKGYRNYYLRKLAWFLVTLVVAFILNFILPRLMPADPVAGIVSRMVQAGTDATGVQAVYEQYTKLFGTDKPMVEQFFIYVKNVFRGDFGYSISEYPRTVADVIRSSIVWTVALQFPAIIVGWILGNSLGALAAYAIEGGGSRNYIEAKKIMLGDPGAWGVLMEKLAGQIIEYLRAQIEWGVNAIQIFDSWVGCLSPLDYHEYVFPHVQRVISEVRGQVPVIYFGTGTATLLAQMMEAAPDVIGIDWHTPLQRGWEIGAKAVQGNMDPVSLFAPREVVLSKAQEVLEAAGGRNGHIFNLGHGILPKTPVDNVKALVDYVHEHSAR